MSSIPIWLRVWPKNKSTKFGMEIESLVQNSGQDPSRGRILYFHIRYSNRNIMSFWYRNQVTIVPNSSTLVELQISWRIKNEINSFWIIELQANSGGNLLAAGFYVFTLDFKQEYLELLISKSSNSKAQIHLRVLEYNFNEGFKVR